MIRAILSRLSTVLLIIMAFAIGILMLSAELAVSRQEENTPQVLTVEVTATETILPSTPLATLTPSQTLRPPPTFEPPTITLVPPALPTAIGTSDVRVEVTISGMHGLDTPTPSTTPGCTLRDDWQLVYEVEFDDALERIAQMYGTTVAVLSEGNCLVDPDLIVVGQRLRVPGEGHPVQPEVICVPYVVHTPLSGTVLVPGEGNLTFNWVGPRALLNLIRIVRPDGNFVEILVERRQNETIDLFDLLLEEGTYTWYVYPLGIDYLQVDCFEGGPWIFFKESAPTVTPTLTPLPESLAGP